MLIMNAPDSPGSAWCRLRDEIFLAIGFLTRLPVPAAADYRPGALAQAMRMFPLAGAVIGALGGGFYVLAFAPLPPLPAALLAVLVMVMITGGLHEDGLADSADGLGARGGREKRLEVMRDSRSGTYGVLALIFSVALRVTALAEAPSAWAGLGACMAVAALSRAMIPAFMQVLPPARSDGLGASAGTPHAGIAATAMVLGAVIAALGLAWAAPAAILAAVIGAALAAWVAKRCFGGFTGDILGAIQQMAELAMWLVIAHYWASY